MRLKDGVMADRFFRGVIWFSAFCFLGLVCLIFILLASGAWLSLKRFGIAFVLGKTWDPIDNVFGMFPFIVGTFLTSVIALLIALPFAISLALLIGFYLRDGILRDILDFALDLLSGVPSVIYGFWGLFFLVPIIRKIELTLGILPYGVGILTASIVLSIMIIPYISSISKEVVRMMPKDLTEAGFSLGARRVDIIWRVVLPYCRSGILAGILLAFGRAFGETMAVTMVIGNSNFLPKDIFSPANTMASVIANEFTEATADIHLSALIQIGMWLFVFTVFVNLVGSWVVNRYEVG